MEYEKMTKIPFSKWLKSLNLRSRKENGAPYLTCSSPEHAAQLVNEGVTLFSSDARRIDTFDMDYYTITDLLDEYRRIQREEEMLLAEMGITT